MILLHAQFWLTFVLLLNQSARDYRHNLNPRSCHTSLSASCSLLRRSCPCSLLSLSSPCSLHNFGSTRCFVNRLESSFTTPLLIKAWLNQRRVNRASQSIWKNRLRVTNYQETSCRFCLAKYDHLSLLRSLSETTHFNWMNITL